MKRPYLETKRLILRAIEPADLEALYRFRSLPKVYRYMVSKPDTQKDTANFIKWTIAERKKKPILNHYWAVVVQKTGDLIGKCNINIVNPGHREASLGYDLHPDFWDQGYATEAAKRMIAFGFKDLKLHRIYATCDPKNVGSRKVLLKAGMKWEGTFRKNMLQKGKWRDTHQYAILSTDK